MSPVLLTALLLLGTLALWASLGITLVKRRKIRQKNASRFAQVGMSAVCVLFYLLAHAAWPGLQLRAIDFWSICAVLALLSYSLLWAPLAHLLNKPEFQEEFGDSFMLSMLYTDSQFVGEKKPPMESGAASRNRSN